MVRLISGLGVLLLALGVLNPAVSEEPKDNTWVKISPTKGGPPSPGMGYETSLGYDPRAKRLLRWGGHNQGGGGEQNAEMWSFDPTTAKWELKEPNRSPPGVCCTQQNVFDADQNRFLRFQSFSGSHGWHWYRENYLNNSTLWNYDLATNTWRDRRPIPTPIVSPLRCASWDSEYQVAVVFGGEGNSEGTVLYDPFTNTWHRRKPAKQPDFRSGGNMAYDSHHKVHVLFGSQFSDDKHTWIYDVKKNEWRDANPEVMPSTNRNDAVLTYDVANRVVIGLIRTGDVIEKDEIRKGHLETWTYDVGKNTWTQQKPAREPDGWANRRRVMTYIPDLQASLVEVYLNPTDRSADAEREQQIWLYRHGPGVRPVELPAPRAVRCRTDAEAATVQWDAVEGATSYEVFRASGETPWEADFASLARGGKETTYRDATAPKGKSVYYRVRALGATPGTLSSIARAQPRVVEDVVVSVVTAKEIRLAWKTPGLDVAGYLVERAVVDAFTEDEVLRLKKDTPPLAEPSVGAIRRIGPFVSLTPTPQKDLTFTDTTVDLTKPAEIDGEPLWRHRFNAADHLDANGKPYRFGVYAYRVWAVDARGVRSGPSAYFLTIPSAPEWLFSQEDGATCKLKWAVNPETGLKGYRVYRMDGPKINGPGQKVVRVTETPITETRHEDAKIGMDTRRYWVVAIDALGQEGVPSAPTWHYRQYRKAYEPFVGEWHQ